MLCPMNITIYGVPNANSYISFSSMKNDFGWSQKSKIICFVTTIVRLYGCLRSSRHVGIATLLVYNPCYSVHIEHEIYELDIGCFPNTLPEFDLT